VSDIFLTGHKNLLAMIIFVKNFSLDVTLCNARNWTNISEEPYHLRHPYY